MKQKLEIFKSDALSLKAELVEYIHDRSIPLDDRWSTWLEAPDLLKEHAQYMTDLDSLLEDFIMHDGEFHAERYQTINTTEIVERINGGKWDDLASDSVPYDIDINKVKEEILSRNLGSFVYDW